MDREKLIALAVARIVDGNRFHRGRAALAQGRAMVHASFDRVRRAALKPPALKVPA